MEEAVPPLADVHDVRGNVFMPKTAARLVSRMPRLYSVLPKLAHETYPDDTEAQAALLQTMIAREGHRRVRAWLADHNVREAAAMHHGTLTLLAADLWPSMSLAGEHDVPTIREPVADPRVFGYYTDNAKNRKLGRVGELYVK